MKTREPPDRDPGPVAHLDQLRDVDPPSSLVAAVMRRVAEPRPPSLWRWLRRPFVLQLRLTPLAATSVALGMALVVAFVLRSPRGPRRGDGGGAPPGEIAALSPAAGVVAAAPSAAACPVRVRFRLQAKNARRVSLAGSFNQWRPDGTVLEPVSDGGIFAGTVDLPPGIYEYMFVVDGNWVTDPAADERRDDGFGRQNSLLRL